MDKVNDWPGIVTNIGVVFVLVAYQIDQTNKAIDQESIAMQAGSYTAGPEVMGEFRLHIVESDELYGIWQRGNAGEVLTVNEAGRYLVGEVDELLKQRHEVDTVHLNWARDTLNWAIYLFKAPLDHGT